MCPSRAFLETVFFFRKGGEKKTSVSKGGSLAAAAAPRTGKLASLRGHLQGLSSCTQHIQCSDSESEPDYCSTDGHCYDCSWCCGSTYDDAVGGVCPEKCKCPSSPPPPPPSPPPSPPPPPPATCQADEVKIELVDVLFKPADSLSIEYTQNPPSPPVEWTVFSTGDSTTHECKMWSDHVTVGNVETSLRNRCYDLMTESICLKIGEGDKVKLIGLTATVDGTTYDKSRNHTLVRTGDSFEYPSPPPPSRPPPPPSPPPPPPSLHLPAGTDVQVCRSLPRFKSPGPPFLSRSHQRNRIPRAGIGQAHAHGVNNDGGFSERRARRAMSNLPCGIYEEDSLHHIRRCTHVLITSDARR